MEIVIIGTGNVATVLGRLIKQSNHSIIQVYGRNLQAAYELAGELGAGPVNELSMLSRKADLYLIAVADDAIAKLAGELNLDNHLVVHTAGSVSREVLAGASKNYGVLYPLQSLRKEMTILPPIPLMVDGNTPEDLTLLYDFASSLSDQVKVANDEQRLHYHLAAVIANNFSNHLFALAEEYCKRSGIDFRLLLPLITQLPQRLQNHSPAELQTGPAIRNDNATINKHLELLKEMPEIKNLYALFTRGIQEYYKR